MGIDVNTIQEPDLHQFTEQQIETYCRKALHPFWSLNEGEILLNKSVQIIKQLQEDIKSRDKLDKQNFESLRACSLSARA